MESIAKQITNQLGFPCIKTNNTDNGISYSFAIELFNTKCFDADKLCEWEDFIDEIDILEDNYEIYCFYKVNHTIINLWISNDINNDYMNFIIDDFKSLLNNLQVTYNNLIKK